MGNPIGFVSLKIFNGKLGGFFNMTKHADLEDMSFKQYLSTMFNVNESQLITLTLLSKRNEQSIGFPEKLSNNEIVDMLNNYLSEVRRSAYGKTNIMSAILKLLKIEYCERVLRGELEDGIVVYSEHYGYGPLAELTTKLNEAKECKQTVTDNLLEILTDSFNVFQQSKPKDDLVHIKENLQNSVEMQMNVWQTLKNNRSHKRRK